uniref:Uncharacterized protein n=1 Tax=Octopus bimaculoides TaxID=37653 RepID=A0A0L8II24_OCTBM
MTSLKTKTRSQSTIFSHILIFRQTTTKTSRHKRFNDVCIINEEKSDSVNSLCGLN